ncbi:hypothetical protein ECTT12B_2962, partial [Escherichia coli TT12B]
MNILKKIMQRLC